jgi:glucosamine 6-phosphate synthetase-like amidotransferase/phosphosugar isomerase protein
LHIATKLHDAGIFMDRKDWLLVLLAATLGVLGTLGGSLVAGYQYERAAARQAQLDLAKQQAAERAAELKALKEAGLSYMNASDALVNNLVFASTRDKALAEHLVLVQSAGNEVVVMADEELARQTMALNQTIARLLFPSAKPMEQRLAELNAQVVEWIKQFKRSLDALKSQHEEAQSFKASTQTVAQLKR